MRTGIVAVLIGSGTLIAIVCCLGLLLLRDVFDRIHFLSGLTVAAILVVAGVVVRTGLGPIGIKALLIALLATVGGPTQCHAIARVARFHDRGTLGIGPSGSRTDA